MNSAHNCILYLIFLEEVIDPLPPLLDEGKHMNVILDIRKEVLLHFDSSYKFVLVGRSFLDDGFDLKQRAKRLAQPDKPRTQS